MNGTSVTTALAQGRPATAGRVVVLVIGVATWTWHTPSAESQHRFWTQALMPRNLNVADAWSSEEQDNKKRRVDAYGDLLPHGAAGRLGTVRFRYQRGMASRVMFTPDSKSLVGVSSTGVIVWDTATGREKILLVGPDRQLARMDISPDSRTLAAADYYSRDIEFWDLRTGQKTGAIRIPEAISTIGVQKFIRFSPDGKLIAYSGKSGKALILDVALGTVKAILGGDSLSLYNECFSPDSKSLAVAAISKNIRGGSGHEVQLWDIATKRYVRKLFELEDAKYETPALSTCVLLL